MLLGPGGNFVIVVHGQTFSETFRLTPSTGYTWQAVYDKSKITLVSEKFVSDPNPHHLVGVGGNDTFTFTSKRGCNMITFNYISPAGLTMKTVKVMVIAY
jgi:predicted secreted protein